MLHEIIIVQTFNNNKHKLHAIYIQYVLSISIYSKTVCLSKLRQLKLICLAYAHTNSNKQFKINILWRIFFIQLKIKARN